MNTETAPRPEFLTIYEAGTILKLHPRTVTRRCEDGSIDAEKLGNRWRIPTSSLYKIGNRA